MHWTLSHLTEMGLGSPFFLFFLANTATPLTIIIHVVHLIIIMNKLLQSNRLHNAVVLPCKLIINFFLRTIYAPTEIVFTHSFPYLYDVIIYRFRHLYDLAYCPELLYVVCFCYSFHYQYHFRTVVHKPRRRLSTLHFAQRKNKLIMLFFLRCSFVEEL